LKKTQIKFGESIGVIIVVYIVLLLGLLWYNNINNKTLNNMFEKDERQRAFEKYQFVNNLDLIHVTDNGIVDEDFSLISLNVMENFSKTKDGAQLLRSQLGESIVSVDLYNYSVSKKELNVTKTLVLYNYTKNNIKKSRIVYRTLIPVYDEIEERYIIGLLNVEVPVS